jgi:hypothetical protein
MYALVENGQITKYPYSATDLIRANPQTSWPQGMLPDSLLASFGVLPVYGDAPLCTPGQVADEVTPTFDGTQWNRQFVIRACTQAETDNQAAQVRSQRDDALVASDWTQVADAPVDQAAWAAYRQALRDISTQAGFPFAVTWPVKP